MNAFDGLPKALRILCVRDGRPLQDIAWASNISPAMLSSYLTGRETPTLKTLEKLLDGLNLSLQDLVNALDELRGRERPTPARSEDRSNIEDLLLGLPRKDVERLFVDQLTRLGVIPRKKAPGPASPQPKPRKPKKP